MSKTITEDNAETKSEISALIFAHKLDNFQSFMSLTERMLDKYAESKVEPIQQFIKSWEDLIKPYDELNPEKRAINSLLTDLKILFPQQP